MRNSFISLFRLIAILIKFNLHSDLKIVYIYITILRSSLIENRFFKQKRKKNSSTILSTICTKSLSLSLFSPWKMHRSGKIYRDHDCHVDFFFFPFFIRPRTYKIVNIIVLIHARTRTDIHTQTRPVLCTPFADLDADLPPSPAYRSMKKHLSRTKTRE